MELPKSLRSLCTPALIYLAMSVVSFLILLFQNLRDPNSYQIGIYKVPTQQHNSIFFLMKALYIMGWTWLLNHLCKGGYSGVSWFLILFPYIALFVIIGGAVVVGVESQKKAVLQ